jgi:predicted phage tail protein
MNNDQTDDNKTEEEMFDELKNVAARGAVVALVGFALWVGGMVVAGKINDTIFGRE